MMDDRELDSFDSNQLLTVRGNLYKKMLCYESFRELN